METFKKAEIVEYFNDFLQDNIDSLEDNDFLEDIHHHAFNTDYYIIGTYQAKQWLGDHAFDVIETIKNYEQDNFGEIFTDLSNPENVVNMYAYIIGEEVVNEWREKVNSQYDDVLTDNEKFNVKCWAIREQLKSNINCMFKEC
jgi:hypothetical protein